MWGVERDSESVLLGQKRGAGPESTRWIETRKCWASMFKQNFRMAEITKWFIFLWKKNTIFIISSKMRNAGNGGEERFWWEMSWEAGSWHLTLTLYQSINILYPPPQIFLSDWLIFPETPNVYITWDSNISKILRQK